MSEEFQQDASADDADAATGPEAVEVDSPGQEGDEAADDAAIAAIKTGGREAAIQVVRDFGKSKPQTETAPTPAGEAATSAATGTTPVSNSGQPSKPNLSAEDRELIRRFQLEEDDVPASPERRTRFLTNLKQRHDDQARMYRELQQRQQVQPATTTPPATPQPAATPQATEAVKLSPEIESRIKWLGENYGDEYANQERQYQTLVAQREAALVAPLQQKLQQWEDAAKKQDEALAAQGAALHQLHLEQGLEQVKKLLPKIALDEDTEAGRANLAKLMAEADTLLQAKFDIRKFNLRHALASAANSVFQTEIQLAERQRLADSQNRTLRGASTRGGNPARTRPAPSEDEIDDLVLNAINEGRPKAEIEQVALGRG